MRGAVQIEPPCHRAVKAALMRAGIKRLQRPVARCRQITGDTAHAKAIGAVRGDRNLDNRVVKTGDGGKTGADRRVGRHLDDAVMFVRDHHLAFRTQHAVGVLATDSPGLQHQINPRHIGAGRRKHALHASACIGSAADHLHRVAAAGIHHANTQPVGIRVLFGRHHLGNGKGRQTGAVIKAFHLEAKHRQGVENLVK